MASLGTVLVGFNSTASNLALDSIRDSFAGATAADVGWGIAGFMIGTAAFLPLAGRLADRIGRKRIFQIGLALTLGPIAAGFSTITFSRLGERWNAVGFCRTGAALQIGSVGWMVLTLGTTPNYWFAMAPSIALFGLGWGMCVPLLNSVALKAVPEKYFGEVSGLFNTLRYASAAIGIAAFFAVLTEDSGPGSLIYYQRALVFFLIAASVGFMSLWIPMDRAGRSAS